MTSIILLIDGDVRLARGQLKLLMRRISVKKQIKHSIKSHRYELVHGEDADFIAYQRKFGDGLWQTGSTWMIPRTEYRKPIFLGNRPRGDGPYHWRPTDLSARSTQLMQSEQIHDAYERAQNRTIEYDIPARHGPHAVR